MVQRRPSNPEIIVGIDAGLCNSRVGYWLQEYDDHAKGSICESNEGSKHMPSVVGYPKTQNQSIMVGEPAVKRKTQTKNQDTVYDAKTLLGKSFTDPEVALDRDSWPFTVVEGEGKRAVYQVWSKEEKCNKEEDPESVMRIIFAQLKEIAQMRMEEKPEVKNCVLSVPIDFNQTQREAMLSACKMAGLTVKSVISEPQAVALTYTLKHESEETKKCLVFDMGECSMSCAVVEIQGRRIKVVASSSAKRAGGR